MPRKGYKCITVNEKTHSEIQKRAKETDSTIKQYIEHLLAKEQGGR